jgi:Isy1-like splicing family
LNDEINKLLREKGHWEAQIKELGGPDYARTGPKMLDHEGREVPGNKGYKYFGAAKELPGIKNLHLMLFNLYSVSLLPYIQKLFWVFFINLFDCLQASRNYLNKNRHLLLKRQEEN